MAYYMYIIIIMSFFFIVAFMAYSASFYLYFHGMIDYLSKANIYIYVYMPYEKKKSLDKY